MAARWWGPQEPRGNAFWALSHLVEEMLLIKALPENWVLAEALVCAIIAIKAEPAVTKPCSSHGSAAVWQQSGTTALPLGVSHKCNASSSQVFENIHASKTSPAG